MLSVELTNDGWTLISSTDLTSFITVRFEQPSDEPPTSLLVPYADLTRICKACDVKQSITVEPAQDDRILITYPIGTTTGEEHLDSLPVGEFPSTPKVKGEPITLSADVRSGILQAFECASTDPTRFVLNGAYIDVSQKDCHSIVGTDGRHLYAKNSFSLPLKDSLIIPNNKFLGWKEFKNDGEWKIKVEKEYLEISSRRYRFITRHVEGTYPNWRQVLPKESKTTVEFVDDSINDIIPRLPTNPKDTNNSIGLRVGGRNKLSVLANGAGTEVDITGAKTNGAPVLIHLNRELLTKALKFGCRKLEIVDELSAMTFSSTGKQLVVMPVRASTPEVTVVSPQVTPGPENQPINERNIPMVNQTTSTQDAANPEADNIDASLELIEALKDSFQDAVGSLKELSAKLKAIQRERKTNTREIQSFRNTIRSLQALKI